MKNARQSRYAPEPTQMQKRQAAILDKLRKKEPLTSKFEETVLAQRRKDMIVVP